MEIVSRTSTQDCQTLVGKTVDAVYQDTSYWHLFVAFRCVDGQAIVFKTEEVAVDRYFDVFPITFKIEATEQRDWSALDGPRRIEAVTPLFRDEWLAPTTPHPEHIGSAPHYVHHAGRGPAPAQALQHTVVLAGLTLRCGEASSILVFASNTAPFNVEVALHSSTIEAALAAFNPTEA